MIDYDPHDWDSHLFDIKGSVVLEIMPRVVVCVTWAVLVVLVNHRGLDFSISNSAHNMVGFALGMLLVTRTNSSYDRFWEGRKLWGGIINESRNMARVVRTWLQADPALMHEALHWTSVFVYAIKSGLRGETELGPSVAHLPSDQVELVRQARHPGLAAATRLTLCLRQARDRGLITDIVYQVIDQNVQQLVDYQGGCERIHSTPLPYPYMVHLRRAIIVYCLTLPFALVRDYSWTTVIAVFLISFLFFGVEEIGVEIEDPFGEDLNDLALDLFCEKIDLSLEVVQDLKA